MTCLPMLMATTVKAGELPSFLQIPFFAVNTPAWKVLDKLNSHTGPSLFQIAPKKSGR